MLRDLVNEEWRSWDPNELLYQRKPNLSQQFLESKAREDPNTWDPLRALGNSWLCALAHAFGLLMTEIEGKSKSLEPWLSSTHDLIRISIPKLGRNDSTKPFHISSLSSEIAHSQLDLLRSDKYLVIKQRSQLLLNR